MKEMVCISSLGLGARRAVLRKHTKVTTAQIAVREWRTEMNDLISRRSALEALTVTEEMGTADLLWLLTTRINDLPTVEAIPIRHAHMLSDEDGNIQCSECGSGECWGNYCMNCGAKME